SLRLTARGARATSMRIALVVGVMTLFSSSISTTALAQCTRYGVPNAPASVRPQQGTTCGTNHVYWDLSAPDGTHDLADYYELYRNNQLITSANWSFTDWVDTGPSGGFVPGTHYKYHVVA